MKTTWYLTLVFCSIFFISKSAVLKQQLLFHFSTDSYVLNSKDSIQLQNLISTLGKEKNQYYFVVKGHTDNEGSLGYNQNLSTLRAKTIKDFLLLNNVKEHQVFISAHSYLNPKATNVTEQGKQENRRVEVSVYKQEKQVKLPIAEKTSENKVIDPAKKQQISFTTGTTFSIPNNAFVDKNGNTIKEKVEIEYDSYNDYKDFITSTVPMSFINGTSDYFSSAGMFSLTAKTINGEEVYLNKNKEIGVNLPASSIEEETELFQFNPETNKWTTIQSALQKQIKNTELVYDTVERSCLPFYGINVCGGVGFTWRYWDTLELRKIISYFENNPPNSDLINYAEIILEEQKVKEEVGNVEKKIKKYSDLPKITILGNGKQKVVKFSTNTDINLKYSELKLLRNIKIISSTELEEFLLKNDTITKINLVDLDKKTITLAMEANDNKEFVLQILPIASKRLHDHNINLVANKFQEYQQLRLNYKEESEQELKKLSKRIEVIDSELKVLNPKYKDDVYYNNLKKMCLYNTVFEGISSDWRHIKIKNELLPLEVENYILALNENFEEEHNHLSLINQNLKNLYKPVKEIVLTRKVVSAIAVDNIKYAFNMSEMGIYNVDRLMKQENLLVVNPKEYKDNNGNEILITNLFLVGNSFNGVIKIDGYLAFTPYSYKIDPKQTYSIMAVDLEGNSYKMLAKEYMAKVKRGDNIFTLYKVKDNKDLDLLAQN